MTDSRTGDVMPGRYRKRPVVIEAVQWDGTIDRADWIVDWIEASGGHACFVNIVPPGIIAVRTPEGIMKATADDWIIRSVEGELYPCKPDVFAATYELTDPVKEKL